MADTYLHDMQWCVDVGGFHLPHYRQYQYDSVKRYIGKKILEVGTGDREFTRLLDNHNPDIQQCVSIEPSKTFYTAFSDKKFPKKFRFICQDLFDTTTQNSLFDTALFIHVLEHIQDDKKALEHTYTVLQPGGRILLIVPAIPWLFSDHDKSLGHHRRYSKATMMSIIDKRKFVVEEMRYQDFFGMLGSLLFFKIGHIRLFSSRGKHLLHGEGKIYDNLVIPFERFIERYIPVPVGLTLVVVLRKK